MDTGQPQYILISAESFPALVRRLPEGAFEASSPDWREAASGDSPCEALQALHRRIERHVQCALESAVRRRQVASTIPQDGNRIS